MSSSLLSIPINKDSYEDLIDKYIGIFGVSSPTRSIVSKIAIGQERAEMSLTILDIESGESSVCEDVVFVNDESFYEKFIKVLIRRLNSDIHVVSNNIMDTEDENSVVYKIVTENNDIVTVEYLDRKMANEILDSLDRNESNEKKLLVKTDSLGEGNYLIFITMMVIIILTLMFVYVLIK